MAHPEGTRPWRKAWRKRWREGSTFRGLSPLAKLACIFSEENADDEGRITSTVRQMADALGGWHHEQKIPRMTMWRAWKELESAGVWSIQAGRTAERETGRTPSTITRLNFRVYQEKEEEGGTQPGTRSVGEAGHSGRGEQKKAEKKKHTPAEPALPEGTDWSGLLAAMSKVWASKYGGKKLVLLGKDFKPLRALVCSLTDVEVWRRWEIYLANDDKFYTGHPVALFCSQVNRFVVAPVSDRFREPWEGASPVGPQDWREAT